MYKAESTGAQPVPADGWCRRGWRVLAPEKPKDNVVDAEFVDVDDKK